MGFIGRLPLECPFLGGGDLETPFQALPPPIQGLSKGLVFITIGTQPNLRRNHHHFERLLLRRCGCG